jgi:hypothetical protein
MCYNCGCELLDDPMGKGHVHEGGGSLTNKSFEYMSKSWGMSVNETKKETLRMLKKEFEKED